MKSTGSSVYRQFRNARLMLSAGLLFLCVSYARADPLPSCDAWLQNLIPNLTEEQLRAAGVSIEPSRRMRAQGYRWEHEIRIALPSSYRATNRAYPVLWVTDGQWFFDRAVAFAAACAPKQIPEMIVVGIGAPTDALNEAQMRRTYDFSANEIEAFSGFGSTLAEAQLKAFKARKKDEGQLPAEDLGGAPRFLKFLTGDVRQALAKDYRMGDDHTLFGDSGGGSFCVYALFAQPTGFHKYVCGSPSLAEGDFETFRLEERYAATHRDLQASVFLGAGETEILQGEFISAFGIVSHTARMAEILKSRGYPSLKLYVRIFPGEDHGTVIPLNIAWGLRDVWQDKPNLNRP